MNLDIYERITAREPSDDPECAGEFVIKSVRTKTLRSAKNDYHTDKIPEIPGGTELLLDFAGDFGCYAMAAIDGRLHKVKFNLEDLDAIDWSFLS